MSVLHSNRDLATLPAFRAFKRAVTPSLPARSNSVSVVWYADEYASFAADDFVLPGFTMRTQDAGRFKGGSLTTSTNAAGRFKSGPAQSRFNTIVSSGTGATALHGATAEMLGTSDVHLNLSGQ